ncbi:MAG: Mpo1-like protein [Candidatus Tyrphobacter sp.]
MTFADFWPRYLQAHSDPRTRAVHAAGTVLGTGLAVAAIATRKPWLFAVALAAGYGPAWFSHAYFERNRPETFRAPFASLCADYVMVWHVLRGTVDEQYEKVAR